MIEVEAKYLVTNVSEFEQAALRWGGGIPALVSSMRRIL